MMKFTSILWIAAATTYSCSDSFMESKVKNQTTTSAELAATADSAGNYSASMDPNSTSTQVLRAASGAVAGSAIAMPPGALSIAVSVTIGEGETLASSTMTQQLGLSGNNASAAGPAVSFVPSSSVQASSPFTLAIPLSTSLALDTSSSNDKLVVMYKWMKVVNGVASYSIGILPRDQLTVGSKSVQFQTTKFGTFQLAVTDTKITEQVNKPTDEPMVMKSDASNPLVGVWSVCEEDKGGSSTPMPTPPPIVGPNLIAIAPASFSTTCTFDWSAGPVYFLDFTFAASPDLNGIAGKNITYSRTGATTQSVSLVLDSLTSLVRFSGLSSPTVPMSETIRISLDPGCYFLDTVANTIQTEMYYPYGGGGGTCPSLAFPGRIYCMPPAAPATPPTSSQSMGGDRFGIKPDVKVTNRESVKFSNNTFIHSKVSYSGPQCTGTQLTRKDETGTYTLGAKASDSSFPIGIKMVTMKGTIFRQENVDLANANPTEMGCGKNAWLAMTPTDLMDSTCSDKSGTYKPDPGTETCPDGPPTKVKVQNGKMYFWDKNSTFNGCEWSSDAKSMVKE